MHARTLNAHIHPLSTRWRRQLFRLAMLLVVSSLVLVGGMIGQLPPAQAAVNKGAGITVNQVDGRGFYGWAGAYKDAKGNNVWCVEMMKGSPEVFGNSKTVTADQGLPAYTGPNGTTSKLTSKSRMRQLAYVMDKYKTTSNKNTAAAAAVAIWMLRERGQGAGGDANLRSLKISLPTSVWQAAEKIVEDAENNATAPGTAAKVTKKPVVSIVKTGSNAGKTGTVNYPAGTTKLTLHNAKFKAANAASVKINSGKPGGSAGTLAFVVTGDVLPGQQVQVSVTANWATQGKKGYNPEIKFYSDTGSGQRLGTYTAGPTVLTNSGTLTGKDSFTLPEQESVSVETIAQSAADLGSTMKDTALLTTTPKGYEVPGGELDFIAYLQPLAGAPKYDSDWQEITEEVDGDSQTVRWSEEELEGMSEAEKCTAQPVYTSPKQPATRAGEYSSPEVTVQSVGTIYWVERLYANGKVTHTGSCGLQNEKTVIEMPGVTTQAQPSARIGEEIIDTAIVTGKFADDADYEIRFQAYSGSKLESGELPLCTAANRIFRSEWQSISEPGSYDSPAYRVKHADGTTIWWVEQLRQVRDGVATVLHTGQCGLSNETTEISQPEVVTKAVEKAVVGDFLTDTAIVSGDIIENQYLRWELSYAAYDAAFELADGTIVDADAAVTDAVDGETAEDGAGEDRETPDPQSAGNPICIPDRLLFTAESSTRVTGAGEYESNPVVATTEHAGTVWWVETLWAIEDGVRTAVHTGECGLAEETTIVTTPEVVTNAMPEAYMGEYLYDSATITGELSSRSGVNHEVSFAAYRVPEDFVAEINPDNPEGAPLNASCEPENLLFETAGVTVEKPGESDVAQTANEIVVESPPTLATAALAGTIWWVETLWQVIDGERSVLHVGECGMPNETTLVMPPEVSSVAVQHVAAGEAAYDVVKVTDPLSDDPEVGYSLVYEAYLQPTSVALPLCNDETKIWESGPVTVTGAGLYRSADFETRQEHVGTIYWVETMYAERDGVSEVVHRGICGHPDEITKVSPTLVSTGGAVPNQVWLGATIFGLLVGAVLIIAGFRRLTP